jgi:methylase of polypeptide subunit release factors
MLSPDTDAVARLIDAHFRGVRSAEVDIGCGAGRLALYLQARGHEVVAIDISPLAVKTCMKRGVHRLHFLYA